MIDGSKIYLIVLAMHNAYLLLSFILSINIVYNYHPIDFSIFLFYLLKLRSETYSMQTYNKYDRCKYGDSLLNNTFKICFCLHEKMPGLS